MADVEEPFIRVFWYKMESLLLYLIFNASLIFLLEWGRKREGDMVKYKNFGISILVAAALTLLTMQCYRPAEEAGPVSIGQDAPKFTLPDLKSQAVSLDQYKGQIVILDFWATWCGPCKISMPVLDELKEQYSGKLVLLAVNQREPANIVREYVLRENLGSRVLLDEDGATGDKYGVFGIPTVVLIDQNGKVRYMIDKGIFPGWDSEMRAEINKLL